MHPGPLAQKDAKTSKTVATRLRKLYCVYFLLHIVIYYYYSHKLLFVLLLLFFVLSFSLSLLKK